jgi:hypothetical protein
MKMLGSNIRETLIGTKRKDSITSLDGNDLIGTGGGGADVIEAGAGEDMIGGFAFDLGSLARSANRGASVNGGAGYDTLVVELTAAKRVSEVSDILNAMKVSNVEEFIYNFASVKAKQLINGTNGVETIVTGTGDANIDMRGGNDYVFTGGGDDIIKGGKGSDFIHAGDGHNTVSGGDGVDYFHFHLTGSFQYTNITDFKSDEDKIEITLDVDQINFLYETTFFAGRPERDYGDVVIGNGPEFNEYVSTSNGRWFDSNDFTTDLNDAPDFTDWERDHWVHYEEDTGSIFISNWVDVDGFKRELRVLVAHVEPDTVINDSDFLFRMM